MSQELPNAVDKRITIFDSLRDNAAKPDIDLFIKEALQLDELKNIKQPNKASPKKPSRKQQSANV